MLETVICIECRYLGMQDSASALELAYLEEGLPGQYDSLLLLDTAGIYEDELNDYISFDEESIISYYMYSSQKLEHDAEKYSNASVFDYYEQICSYLEPD